MTHNDDEAWIGIREAARHTGLSVGFFRKAIRDKRIPFARAGSKALRFRRSDLDNWLEAHGNAGELHYTDKKGR
jgi:excisionase family DNA binding protein